MATKREDREIIKKLYKKMKLYKLLHLSKYKISGINLFGCDDFPQVKLIGNKLCEDINKDIEHYLSKPETFTQ
jgi:hypothetical protein